MSQKIFCPIDFEFSWTDNWYEWDREAAHKAALKARNDLAKRMKDAGRLVQKFSLKDQLVRRGGIGSGRPDVEFFCNCYGVNFS